MKKVLVVDDNKNDLQLLRYNLEKNGFTVLAAANGLDALEVLEKDLPDFIISDALMPKMDGFQLLKKIKSSPDLRKIPFIFYSCVYVGKNEEDLALSLGAAAFLIKPLEPKEFWMRLKKILEDTNTYESDSLTPMADDQERFLEKYSSIVATKLEEKVQEIEAVKEKWERTFGAMDDILTIQDKNMLILQANQKTCDFFNMKLEDIIGKYCYELFREAKESCEGCPVAYTLGDILPHSETISHKRLNKIFHVSCSPVLDKDGNLDYLVHVAKDITDQKKVEEELFQAHKMEAMGTLAGGIAHDFNNILAAILGYAELSREELLAGRKPLEYIGEILKASDRAKELVKQILTFSRKTEIQVGPLQPHLIVKEALKFMRASLPSTIEIIEDIDVTTSAIIADPTKLNQMVVNLCTNALHAMEGEIGTLTVGLRQCELSADELKNEIGVQPGSFIGLTVQDTGIGMSAETLSHIFDPYFTTKDAGKGTGLGLSVVHGIIKGMEGMIKVESNPGQGTTFSIFIPAIKEKTAAPRKEAPGTLPGGSERIMVVDDEPVVAQIHKSILEHLGYKVADFTSSKEALARFKEDPNAFDLILTDQTMPNMPGSEMTKECFKLRPDIPIILCTGFSSILTEEQARILGVRKYLEKPVHRNSLAFAVREVLDEVYSESS